MRTAAINAKPMEGAASAAGTRGVGGHGHDHEHQQEGDQGFHDERAEVADPGGGGGGTQVGFVADHGTEGDPGGAGARSNQLKPQVGGDVTPRKFAGHREAEGDRPVEVGPGDLAEATDQGDQHEPEGQRHGEGVRGVPAVDLPSAAAPAVAVPV